MASFFSHPAFPVALKASGLKAHRRLLIWCVLLTLLPDADVIAFKFGIAYASPWGHRGFTHSISFAVIIGLISSANSFYFEERRLKVFLWTFLSTLSHSIFDALTNGGLGVALFWPYTNERYFFPWTPVEVSPIGVKGFLSVRGLQVVMSELIWLWIPSLILGGVGRIFLKKRKGRESHV